MATKGIRVFQGTIREYTPQTVLFYPLGMPDMTNRNAPVALGMRASGWTALAVRRLEGAETVELPADAAKAEVLYPIDLGIEVRAVPGKLMVRFPRPKMACVLRL